MADPQLITWIKQAASQTGADPVALLATSLQESGGTLNGPPGDQGTSFGPFQFHIGGALGTHSPAWASTYPAILNRAQQFARYQVRGGNGAAAVQRPKDRVGYARGVDGLLDTAYKLLHAAGANPDPSGINLTKAQPAVKGHLAFAGGGPMTQLDILNAKSPGEALATLSGARQKIIVGAQAAVPAVSASPVPGAGNGRVTLGNYKLIGTPNAGTHTLGNWESDNAIDIAMPARTPIYAAADGVIGPQIGSLGSGDPRFAGLRLHLVTADNELYYQHLAQITVRAGQHVKRGALLGYSGALNHLHLGVKTGDPRRYQ